MTGGDSAFVHRRAGALAIAAVWALVVCGAVLTLGVVTGLIVGMWGAPILVGLTAAGVHALRQVPWPRSEPEPAVRPELRPGHLTAG